MTAEQAVYQLPKVMKIDACGELYHFFLTAQGQEVVLDCSQVTRLHGLGAQTMMLAAQLWQAAGVPFRIEAPSDDFVSGCETLGLTDLLPIHGDPA